ncbi:subtilase family protein [Sarocladium implicatum]|nr:subtilase family protein [Sarocladium implicatum]
MSRDPPPPSGHNDLMEMIAASLVPSELRGELRSNLRARGNVVKSWREHLGSPQSPSSEGRLWIVDRVLEPVTLANFASFLSGSLNLPGGEKTELPLLGMDVEYLMRPRSDWAPAPYNTPGRSTMQDLTVKIGSVEDGTNLQKISLTLVDMKSRIWSGHAPMSDRLWAERRLDEPQNFSAACQIIVNVLYVYFYLNADEVRNNLRKTYNAIWDGLKEFETALNAKRRLESLAPVSPTALWAEYMRNHYARMESVAHAWLLKRLNALKEKVLLSLASHMPVGPLRRGYDETQWTLLDRWQDIVHNVSCADFAVFLPMDGYKGCTSASATGRPLAGSGMYSGTTPLRFSPSLKQREKDYHVRRRQIGLMDMINAAGQGHAMREAANSPASLVRTCCQQEEAQDKARAEWRISSWSSTSNVLREIGEAEPWGFVAYRGCHDHTDAQWADFVANFQRDIRDWGKGVDGISALKARSKIHWLDTKELGLDDTAVETLRQHFKSYQETPEFPKGVTKSAFLVADEASVNSYLHRIPDPPPNLVGDFGGFITAVDGGYDIHAPVDRPDESPGYKGQFRVLGSVLWDDFCALLAMQTMEMRNLWPLAMHHPFEVLQEQLIPHTLTMKAFTFAAIFSGIAAAVDVVPGSYIVQLKADTIPANHHRSVRSLLQKRDTTVQSFSIGDAFKAYVATSLTSEEAAALEARQDVLSVEPDVWFYHDDLNQTETSIESRALTTQSPAGSWGLADASHKAVGASDYVYDDSAGAGQTVYVVDSGIRITHQEFEGRARFGFSGVTGGTTYEADDDGHGTHVAGTIAGKTYGVAKKAQVVAVKTFQAGAGQSSWVLNGINWAVNDIIARNAKTTSVINLSLGGQASGGYTAIENAVRAAWNQGIVSVTAAGNGDEPAANSAPARIPETITVGMIGPTRRRTQLIAGVFGSNYGPELDVFAPGQDIVSAGYTSDSVTRVTSGTSMATPLVSGLVCYLRRLEGGLASPESVKTRLVQLGHSGVVTDPKGSPNVLVYNGSGR